MSSLTQCGRVKSVDIARGIAIICIILGHFGLDRVNHFVFTFHVPIFYLITGYFISDRTSVWDFTKKRLRTLIVPYYITCIAIVSAAYLMNELLLHWGDSREIAIGWIKASLYGAGDSYSTPFPIKGIGAIWFLWATFWASLFLRMSLSLKPLPRLAFVLALFAVGFWTRKQFFWFPLSIQAGCCATLFLYFGYLCRQILPCYRELPPEFKTAWSVSALAVWVCFIRNFKSFWLVHCDIGRGIIDIFGSLCACFCILQFSDWLDQHGPRPVVSLFSFLGEYSIFTLCAHMVELDVVPWYVLQDMLYAVGLSPYFNIVIVLLCKMIWAIIITVVFANWNVTRRLAGLPPK